MPRYDRDNYISRHISSVFPMCAISMMQQLVIESSSAIIEFLPIEILCKVHQSICFMLIACDIFHFLDFYSAVKVTPYLGSIILFFSHKLVQLLGMIIKAEGKSRKEKKTAFALFVIKHLHPFSSYDFISDWVWA